VTILAGRRESFKVWLRVMLEAGSSETRVLLACVRHVARKDRMPGWRRVRGLG
jgi:hypothetical protein